MSRVVVEITNWPASEAYKSNLTVINPALELLASTKGSQRIWHGLQIEDKLTVFLIVIWDSLADHQALGDDKTADAKFAAALKPSLSGAFTFFHVAFTSTPASVDHLDSPISEFIVQTLKEGQASATLEALFVKANNGGRAFASGKVVEKEDQYVVLKG